MPITQFLERNAEQWPNDVALVELNPDIKVPRLTTWKEYELIQPLHEVASRQEITWAVFNEKANRVANMLIARGIVKGDKVAILLMNCLDWLPIYFGILKTGAIAVPLNFRYSADEIEYCVKLAEADVLIFGPEFIGRVEEIADSISRRRLLLYDGPGCPSFAEDFVSQTANYSSIAPNVEVTSASLPCITQAPRCTGSEASSPAARLFSLEEPPPRRSSRLFPTRNAPLYGSSFRGHRIFWIPSTTAVSKKRTIAWISGA